MVGGFEEIVIFAVNRSLDEVVEYDIEIQGFTLEGTPKMSDLSGFDLKAVNTKSNGSVKPRKKNITQIAVDNTITAELAPLSWNVIRVGVNGH